MEKWLGKELELNQRHEEIVMRREALLHGTETYYNVQDKKVASFIADFAKAKQRNEKLLQDIQQCQENMQRDVEHPGSSKFRNVKNNYWTMIKNVFPVWQEEMKEYQRRHRSPGYSPVSPRARSTTPTSHGPQDSLQSREDTLPGSQGLSGKVTPQGQSTFSVSGGTKLPAVCPAGFTKDFSAQNKTNKTVVKHTFTAGASSRTGKTVKSRNKQTGYKMSHHQHVRKTSEAAPR